MEIATKVKAEVEDDHQIEFESYCNYPGLKEEGSELKTEEEEKLEVNNVEEDVKPPLAVFLLPDVEDSDDENGEREQENIPREKQQVVSSSCVETKQAKEIPSTGLEDGKCDFPIRVDDNVNSRKQKIYTSHKSMRRSAQGGHFSSYLRIHPGEKSLRCSVCKMCFPYKYLLLKHLQVHTGENPFHCSECKKDFKHMSSLNKHKQVHTGEKPFRCGVCHKRFAHKTYVTTHMRVHTGEKPFRCDYCQKSFSVKQSVVEHMRVHTGEKPFYCGHCNKCFSYKQTLVTHMRMHTGEKPFHCSKCGKGFSQKLTLILHERVHLR